MSLALAAGGARGAYHVGALLFFAETGVRFDAVAGTSIGALNAAFYAAGDRSPRHIGELLRFWRRLPDANPIVISPTGVRDKLSMLFAATRLDWPSVVSSILTWSPILDPEPLARLLDDALDFEAICRSQVRVYIAIVEELHPLLDILIGHTYEAEYLEASSMSAEVLRRVLLAAAAIPALFPSVDIGGRKFADAALADALPGRILMRTGEKRIVSIFLSNATIQDRADYPDAALFQLRPTFAIDGGIRATLDFSRDAIERLIEMGYNDARQQYNETTSVLRPLIDRNAVRARAESLAHDLPRRD